MVSAHCWRCLSTTTRSSPHAIQSLLVPRTATAAFSTTPASFKTPPKAGGTKKGTVAIRRPGEQTTFKRKKKNVPTKTGKAPMPGERKAMRKRVVLSNTNALEVVGLKDFDKAMLEEVLKPEFKESGASDGLLGKVVGLQGETVDALRAVEAFKPNQGWGLFRRPGVLMREESVVLSRKIVDAEKKKQVLRLVVDGDKGTGKSLMLVQALATAVLRDWVVMTIPEAQDITNAVTPYQPVPSTTPLQYSQNTYIANMFSQILKANNAILSKLNTEVVDLSTLPIPIKEKTVTLARLCELGARDPEFSWAIFEAFWTEITQAGRPPMMFTLDGLNYILRNSEYRSAKYELIHSFDLAIIKKFTDLLSGAATLPNGGAIIAATSRSHAPLSKSLTLAIKQQEDRQNGREVTKLDPFEREYDPRADEALKSVDVLKVGGLNKEEARGLMEYWAQSGVFRGTVNEKLVNEKWALAGSGVVAEIERATLKMRI